MARCRASKAQAAAAAEAGKWGTEVTINLLLRVWSPCFTAGKDTGVEPEEGSPFVVQAHSLPTKYGCCQHAL